MSTQITTSDGVKERAKVIAAVGVVVVFCIVVVGVVVVVVVVFSANSSSSSSSSVGGVGVGGSRRCGFFGRRRICLWLLRLMLSR